MTSSKVGWRCHRPPT